MSVAIAVVGAERALADDIVLKGSVRMGADAAVVRMGDVARIEGEYANQFAAMVLADAPRQSETIELSVQDVRSALDEAGVHWGKVQLAGRAVIVRGAGSDSSGPLLAMSAASVSTSARAAKAIETDAFEPAESLVERKDLRGAIARAIVQGLLESPQDVRLAFDGGNDALLASEPGAVRYEIEPLSSFASDRIELGVREWADGRVQDRHAVTVRPLVRLDVVLLKRDVNRGDQIRQEDCSVERQWLPPSQAGIASNLVDAVGRVAETKLQAGDVLRKKHVKREDVIRRGDRVVVRCLVGGVVISLEAEARSDGPDGDQIELRKLGEKETFFATATGPGSAVMDMGR